MAKINFGNIVQDARGKLAGTVFSANKGGAYVRRKASPTGPATDAQAKVRANFGANSKMWSQLLSDEQRAAWKFFAAANPRVDVFGNSIVLSGMAMMQSLNQVLAQILEPPITDAPVDMSVPALATPTGLTADVATPKLTVATSTQAVVAGALYYIFATGGMQAGKTPQRNQYRFLTTHAATAAATAIELISPWEAAWGDPITGQRVSVIVATVNTATGATTPGLKFSTLWA
jgi:hypothetical protein